MGTKKISNGIKGILKSVGKAFVIGYFTVAMGFMTFYAAAAIKSDVSTKKYNTTAYVKQLLQEFEVSSDYLTVNEGYYRRIEYNKNAPIFVSFSKDYDKYPQLKEYAIKALDYVFGIVNKINSNYSYKIVSEAERAANCAIGRSTIRFENGFIPSGNSSYVIGTENRPFNFYDILPSDNNSSSNKIIVDLEKLSQIEDQHDYTFKHEIMHAFGFSDIYVNYVVNGVHYTDNKRRIKGDTFMDIKLGTATKLLTPKDFASLCALYMPKVKGSDEELKSRISRLIEEYEEAYYPAFAKACLENLKNSKVIDFANLRRPENLKYLKTYNYFYKTKNDMVEYNYHVTINDDGTYYFKVTYEDGTFIESCTGKTIKTDEFLILQNCTLKNGLMPDSPNYSCEDGYIQNLCLYTDGKITGMFALIEYKNFYTENAVYKETNQEIDDSKTL